MHQVSTEYEPIIDILDDILGEYRMHNDYKGQISYDCPVCSHEIKGLDDGDGKGNLEINYKKGVYKCWSCAETHNTHGSLYKLVKKHGTNKQLKNFLLLKPDNEDENSTYSKVKHVELPNEFIPFLSASNGLKMTHFYKHAYNYVKSRNITDEMLMKYNIGFCYEGPYMNRIIIPSYDKWNNVNYFVARSYIGRNKFKYKNPEAQKEIIIWNEHLINWMNKVYVVEGVFDSIFLPNSIPMLGKFMSDVLFDLLYENALQITIVLDGDAWDDAVRLFHRLNCGRLFNKVNIIKLPMDQDIADLQGNLEKYEEFKID